ncbi:MAG: hypothetical protein MZU97_02580 [Bacillus subtilis]|nr:hypothetical protein [Bacillus subtilis]
MKIIFLFPPQWTPLNPHLCLSSLMGQVKDKGYEAKIIDLNIEIYNKILNKDFVLDAAEQAFCQKENLFLELKNDYEK